MDIVTVALVWQTTPRWQCIIACNPCQFGDYRQAPSVLGQVWMHLPYGVYLPLVTRNN